MDEFETERTTDEVDEQWGLAVDSHGKWPGMTYEDGVRNTIEWLRGDREEGPMSDE